MASKSAEREVSPKIKHGSNASAIVTLIVAVVSKATDQFGGSLGDWAAPLGMVLATAVFAAVGYVKRDPKRVSKNVREYMDRTE